jgi:hypothetical protein
MRRFGLTTIGVCAAGGGAAGDCGPCPGVRAGVN